MSSGKKRGRPRKKLQIVEEEEDSNQIDSFDFLEKPIKLEEPEHFDNIINEDFVTDGLIAGSGSNSPNALEENLCGEFVIQVDIREPLTALRSILESQVGENLSDFKFSLQDTQILEDHKNLVDQCMQGEGIVQVNCELKTSPVYGKRINIVDVLKPDDEQVDLADSDDSFDESTCSKWIADNAFRNDQKKHGIPNDPSEWTVSHVRHWLMWAVRQFNLSGINLSEWAISGSQLISMTRDEFRSRVSEDPNNIFWTHIELIRKCKVVATNQINPEAAIEPVIASERSVQKKEEMNKVITTHRGGAYNLNINNIREVQPSGQPVQLWQFLLDLLTNYRCRNAIQWLENDGEFMLVNPELVAHLWGLKKNKPTMNYEKLSRALRYYYDGEMISKVPGKRFVYRFDCDLKQIIGYSASELNQLCIEAEEKAKLKEVVGDAGGSIYINDKMHLVA